MTGPRAHLRDVADGAVLIEYPETDDEEANRAAAALGRLLLQRATAGLHEAIPAARTLLVLFDPIAFSHARLEREAGRGRIEERDVAHRLLRIPVAYGGEAGADLAELARAAAMTPESFVSRHSDAEYRVAFIGFAPGFPYLAGLRPELASPRLSNPRPRVPAGAVAIGGSWTGIYPAATPGGWRLIGRTTTLLFDPLADPPALFSPGDRVRFDPVAEASLPAPTPRRAREPTGRPVLRVTRPGVFSSIQGAARYGHGGSGVPPGGAMDPLALAAANRLVGNPDVAPALEVALGGTELEVLEDSVAALAGGDLSAEWNENAAPLFEAFRLRVRDRLRFGRARRGARAYLAVAGGLASGALGQAGRVEAGEGICAGDERVGPPRPPGATGDLSALRVLPGPQLEFFARGAWDDLLSRDWRVSASSDRRGIRLEGEPLAHSREPEIPPEGTAPGSIQVPGGGLPIVLGPDRPVTGGYPKIATVIGADLPLLGQLAAGALVRFRAVTLAEALAERRRIAAL